LLATAVEARIPLMTETRTRRWMTVLTTLGAVAFGVVLAGGVNWTPAGYGATGQDGAVSVHAARGGLPGFADLAEAVAPAVVTIRAVSFQEAPGGNTASPHGKGDPFYDFFFGPNGKKRDGSGGGGGDADHEGDSQDQASPGSPERPGPLGGSSGQEQRSEAGGSGFVISGDGMIATNYHVIEGASELMVTVGDDPRELPAKVRGADPATDLALLQIDAGRKLPYLRLAAGNKARVGDWVMVIGNPLRLGRTVTVGVVSAVGRTGLGITDVSFENFLQTDAAINFGNSGGPMLDLDGEVVGIATAINWGAENVGFAVPASTLSKVLPQLERAGKVRRGFLGVNVENLDYKAQEAFGLQPAEGGALVIQVNENTPGAQAGLEHGDIILTVDGHPVKTTRDLIDYVSDHPPGSQVQLDVLHEGKRAMRTVTIGERPGTDEEKVETPSGEPASPGMDWLGLRYGDLSPAIRSSHGIPDAVQGVWVRGISPHSPLVEQSVDVEPGDVIVEINGRQVKGVADFESVIKAARSGAYLRFYVQRFDPRSGRSGQFFAFARVP
jgi:serine protease Do